MSAETTETETTTSEKTSPKATTSETTAIDKKIGNEFEEFMWMENEDKVNLEFEQQILEEEIQELELEEMLEEEEDCIEGRHLTNAALMSSSPVVNGVTDKQDQPAESEKDGL
ncbi:polyadenylate-binding protein-interacting protein 2B-like [Corticium candelabrum]|uniref:polyadenylate-binding protein-interacting protein 2B-like n=1 Tax=Corticium candelabrum TaxID=121492 RepID=UPI002E2642FA|nr:polyadenylate-binding protein-interacting protein 2B-like [Corticium candelabrum]